MKNLYKILEIFLVIGCTIFTLSLLLFFLIMIRKGVSNPSNIKTINEINFEKAYKVCNGKIKSYQDKFFDGPEFICNK